MNEFLTTPGFDLLDTWWWPYAFLVLAGFLPTEIWRQLAVFVAGNLAEQSPVLIWVRGVATALVAAVVSKLVLFPSGALATSPLALRIAAVAFGFAVFRITGGKVGLGVVAAIGLLVSGWFLIPTIFE